ncbi:MAG: hypothetical protein JWO31_750 [Phycisphaerales bacterium]|nr:hypothetical protein [Phycisphaerales bacterium]
MAADASPVTPASPPRSSRSALGMLLAMWVAAAAAQAAFLWRGEVDDPVHPLYFAGYCAAWWLAIVVALVVAGITRPLRSGPRPHNPLPAVLVLGWMINLALVPVGFAVSRAIYHRHADHAYRESAATITVSRVSHTRSSGRHSSESWDPVLEFNYVADGTHRSARGSWPFAWANTNLGADEAQALVSRFQVGKTYPCWFDPGRPDRALLDRTHARATSSGPRSSGWPSPAA